MEIVKLIGGDVLPDDQKLILEIAKVIRVGLMFLKCLFQCRHIFIQHPPAADSGILHAGIQKML